MADRNPPPIPKSHREDAPRDADTGSFAYDRNAAAEDPLVELARIVGETGRLEPDFAATPRTPAARPSLDDDFTDGLEAELMAELRPSYQDNAGLVPNHGAPPVQASPRQASPLEAAPVDQEYNVQPEATQNAARAPQAGAGVTGHAPGFSLGRDTSFSTGGQQAGVPVTPPVHPYDADEYRDNYSVEAETAFVPEPAFGQSEPAAPDAYEPAHETYEAPPVYESYEAPGDDIDNMAWPAAASAISDPSKGYYNETDQDQPRADGLQDGFDDIFEPETAYTPGVSEDHVLPPHSAAERDLAPEARSGGRGLIVAGTVVGIMLLGGVGFLVSGLFGDAGPDGPAVVIAADTGPFKVFPSEQRNETSNPSKAIYDRVGGVAAPRDEQLVSREEAPVDAVPTTSDSQPRLVTGDQADQTQQVSEPVTTNGLPRRVRTVVVRPDGTIINAPSDEPVTAFATDAPTTIEPVSPVAVAPSIPVETTNSATPSLSSDPVAVSPVETASGFDPQDPANLIPRAKPAVPAGQRVAALPTQVPTASQGNTRSGPLDLSGSGQAAVQPPATVTPAVTPTATAPAQGASIPSGTYVVQISSQRSREQAETSYVAMQRRYPSVLGGVPSVIQTADLGDRGVYYRVRVVAENQNAANRLCSNLKAAGGDCFVRRAE